MGSACGGVSAPDCYSGVVNAILRRLVVLCPLGLAGSLPAPAEPPAAGGPVWLPESCVPLVAQGLEEERGDGGSPEARWNRHYRAGWGAADAQDLDGAERRLCRALDAARGFDARDPRFAETLDELGLVHYLRGDDVLAEAMQGAAVGEMLLALGPPAGDLTAERADLCRSSVATYLVRLGWILERQGRPGRVEAFEGAPYLVLGEGYVPTEAIAHRLDWLISRYLLAEDLAAADWLTRLRERLLREE